MFHRSESKPLKNRLNPYSQSLVSSASVRPHFQPATWANPLIQSMGERQRQARRATTHDISSRTASLDPNRCRSRPLRNTSEYISIRNHKTIRQRYIAPGYGEIGIRERSAPNILPRVGINSERRAQVTWTSRKTSERNQNLSEFDQQDDRIENSNQANAPIGERLVCEITMCYASTTASTAEESNREEIIVMQRYSTGETSLVYRGYLTKGENFSFKSQRRSTSSLSLAFFVQGLIDGVTSECCEFKCVQKNSNSTEQKNFLFKDIQKANPCEKCRKDYADDLLLNNTKNTLLVRRRNTLKPSSADNHIEEKESANKYQQQKKTLEYDKPKSTEVPHVHQTETTTTDDTNLPESDKPAVLTAIQPSSIHIEQTPVVPIFQSTEQKSTKKSENNSQDSDKTETITPVGAGIDIGQILQMLAAHHKSIVGIPSQQQQSSRTKRHPKSVENFCYILESQLSISTDEQQTLRGLINFGFTFDDINSNECIEFLKKIADEKIILILSKGSMENLAKPIQDELLLCAIYVIDSLEKSSFDSKFYRGSFPHMTRVCQQLKSDLQLLSDDLTTICSIPANHAGMSTLNYVQALKDILLETDEKRDSKQEMIDFCREEYTDNTVQLKLIDEFANHFQAENAIHWYLRDETFLHKMMTRAFRVLDPVILFKLRYFIQHLHHQLKSYTNTSALTVYRTLRIRKDLFNKMKNYPGALLSFNEFLLTNKNQSTIEPSPVNTDSKMVRFQIVLGNGVSRCDVATKSNEVLLTVGTIFRVDKLEQIDNETFTAELSTNDEILKAGQLLTNSLRDAIRAPLPLIRMVRLMKQRELTDHIEYFCSMLIDDPPAVEDRTSNLTLGGLLHSLGSYYYEKKQYEQALNHLRNSLNIYLRVLPDDDVKLTPTYNNIGSIYHKQGLNEEALEYHLKAYKIQKNSSDPDLDSIAAYVGNISSVLIKLGRHKEAVSYLELDLQIKQKLHPNNDHPDIAAKYHNLAGAQYRLHQYSKALENYQKCLDIELKCHSNENPTVAVTYYNMATAFEELGQWQEAKDAVEKGITRLLLTKKEDDEEIQMQRRYLQRIEQKIWMKTLFETT